MKNHDIQRGKPGRKLVEGYSYSWDPEWIFPIDVQRRISFLIDKDSDPMRKVCPTLQEIE